MKSNTLKHLLLLSLAMNISIIGTIGYRYYQRTTYWTSPFGHLIQRDKFLFEDLSLKPGQVEAMRKRAIPFRAEIDRQRVVIATKKKGLVTLLRQDHPDLPAIRSQIAKISALQEEMQQQVANHMLEEKALLDKEQQQRFFDLIDNAMSTGSQTGCPSVE